jgi:hypothetical protein
MFWALLARRPSSMLNMKRARLMALAAAAVVAAISIALAPPVSAQVHATTAKSNTDDGARVAHVPSATYATSTPSRTRTVSVLFALTAARGTLTAVEGKKHHYVLTLHKASDHVTWFTDRPARQSGFLPTSNFVSSWASYGFSSNPPNIALVVRESSGATDTVVAVMTGPKVTAKGVFTAKLRVLSMDQTQALSGHLAGHAAQHDMKVTARFTAAAMFMDNGDWNQNPGW